MPDAINPYKILRVDPEAEDEVITAAYRRLARKYHPDLAATPDAPARMAAINAAWELIGDPAKRLIYDRMRRAASAGPRSDDGRPGSGSAGGASADAFRRGTEASAGTSTPPGDPHRESSSGGRPGAPPPPDFVSRDWTSGRSTHGGGFDESMRAAQGHAGPPPGRPSGRVLNF